MNYTSIEQSKKLLSLGLKAESADMWYQHIGVSIKDGSQKSIYFPMVIRDNESDEDIPCWSVGALLDVIPFLTQITTSYKKTRVDVVIIYKKGFKDSCHYERAETLIDALVQMITWLYENKCN